MFLLLAAFSDTLVLNNKIVNNVKMVCSETLQKGWAGYRPTFSDFIDKLEKNQI